MPMFVVEKVQNALNDHAKPVKGSHIHIVGMAYKRDIDDIRESPALDLRVSARDFSDVLSGSGSIFGIASSRPASSASSTTRMV